jgi:hypothetical protein
MPDIKRPPSIRWAGFLFWLFSLGTLVLHVIYALRGVVDIWSFLFAGLLLVAAFLWLLIPRAYITFCIGSFSLLMCVLRSVLVARTQYMMHEQYPDLLVQSLWSLGFSFVIAGLAYRYIFGVPARKYFDFA